MVTRGMITYLIIVCLDRSQYDSADLKTAVFKSTSVIQGVLSKVIYTPRLYTLTYLCHLTENNGVENSGVSFSSDWPAPVTTISASFAVGGAR